MAERLVIVGAGMATAYLLQELGKRHHAMAVTVIGEERQACYNRVLLSHVLSGENSEADLRMLRRGGEPELVTGTRVTAIDTAGRRVLCDDGREFDYQRLVIATGASVARPALDCEGIAGVEVFRTLQDARHLRQIPVGGSRAIVVGGGLLGLEAAHGLNELGFNTAVLHRNRWLMNRQLDEAGGACLQRALEHRGIDFYLDASVAELHSESGRLTAVSLDDGRKLPCELLLFATGIAPNAGLARHCGIDTRRGVLVDAFMRTSADGVYALGECCQFGRHCFGLVAPIRAHAAVLARVLCHETGPGFEIEDWPTQLKISGIEIYCAGELEGESEQLVLTDRARRVYRRLAVRDGRLVGAVLVGDKRGGTWYSELIHDKRDIAGLRQGLMFGREVAEALQLTATAA